MISTPISEKNIIAFTLANVVGLLLSTISSLWLANIAGPRLMGMYNTLQLLVNYAPVLTLGIINGLNRELPYMLGKGKNERAQRMADTSHFFSLVVACVSGFVIGLIGVMGLIKGSFEWGTGLLAFAIIVPISLIRFFVEVTYRTGQDFVWLSWVKMFSGIVAVVSVPLLYVFLWEGLLVRALLIAGLGLYLLWIKRKLITFSRWNYKETFSLIKIGLPIFIVGYLYTWVLSLDRVIIAAKLGIAAVGIYTPAILILQGMAVVPSSVMQVMYPRLAEIYGKTGSANAILPLLFKPLPILFLVQIPFVVLGWLFLPDFIQIYMPKYIEGIDAAKWAVVAGFILSLSCPALSFNILRKQMIYGLIMILSAGLLLIVATLLINAGLGLKGVAMALSAAFGFFVVACGLASIVICKLDVRKA